MRVITLYKSNQANINRVKLIRIIKEELFCEELERRIQKNMGRIVAKAKKSTKFLMKEEEVHDFTSIKAPTKASLNIELNIEILQGIFDDFPNGGFNAEEQFGAPTSDVIQEGNDDQESSGPGQPENYNGLERNFLKKFLVLDDVGLDSLLSDPKKMKELVSAAGKKSVNEVNELIGALQTSLSQKEEIDDLTAANEKLKKNQRSAMERVSNFFADWRMRIAPFALAAIAQPIWIALGKLTEYMKGKADFIKAKVDWILEQVIPWLEIFHAGEKYKEFLKTVKEQLLLLSEFLGEVAAELAKGAWGFITWIAQGTFWAAEKGIGLLFKHFPGVTNALLWAMASMSLYATFALISKLTSRQGWLLDVPKGIYLLTKDLFKAVRVGKVVVNYLVYLFSNRLSDPYTPETLEGCKARQAQKLKGILESPWNPPVEWKQILSDRGGTGHWFEENSTLGKTLGKEQNKAGWKIRKYLDDGFDPKKSLSARQFAGDRPKRIKLIEGRPNNELWEPEKYFEATEISKEQYLMMWYPQLLHPDAFCNRDKDKVDKERLGGSNRVDRNPLSQVGPGDTMVKQGLGQVYQKPKEPKKLKELQNYYYKHALQYHMKAFANSQAKKIRLLYSLSP